MSEMSVIDEQPIEHEDEWLDDVEELPRRPRRKLLAPVPLTLLGVLLTACGFIAGVEVQKGQQPASTASGRGAGAFAALRGARGAGASPSAAGGARGAGATATGTSAAGSAGAGAGGSGAGAGAGGTGAAGATVGQVANIDGSALYVTNAEGNTVKVKVPAGLKVSKTVSTSAHNIHPGETVVVLGSPGSGGSIEARSISIGATAGLGALFGGSRAGGSAGGGGESSSSGSSGSGAGGGRPTTLFGG
jgi:hypothetical protein